MKRLGVFLLPVDWYACPSQVTPPLDFAWVLSCPRTQHNTVPLTRSRTQTARSEDERNNHEATAPPLSLIKLRQKYYNSATHWRWGCIGVTWQFTNKRKRALESWQNSPRVQVAVHECQSTRDLMTMESVKQKKNTGLICTFALLSIIEKFAPEQNLYGARKKCFLKRSLEGVHSKWWVR